MNVEETFKNVVGREMTPDEVTRYLKFQKEFRIPDTDPTWMIFIWFEFYQRIFEKFPENARAETEKMITQLRSASIAVTEATAAEVKAAREKAALEIVKAQEAAKAAMNQALSQTMSAAVQRAIDQIVQSTHVQALKIQARKWALTGAVTAAVLVVALAGGVGWEAYRTGLAGGYASGVAVGGNFRHFMDCDLPGWKLEQKKDGSTWCYPTAAKDGTYGWRIR